MLNFQSGSVLSCQETFLGGSRVLLAPSFIYFHIFSPLVLISTYSACGFSVSSTCCSKAKSFLNEFLCHIIIIKKLFVLVLNYFCRIQDVGRFLYSLAQVQHIVTETRDKIMQYKSKMADEADLRRRLASLEESVELHEHMKRQVSRCCWAPRGLHLVHCVLERLCLFSFCFSQSGYICRASQTHKLETFFFLMSLSSCHVVS